MKKGDSTDMATGTAQTAAEDGARPEPRRPVPHLVVVLDGNDPRAGGEIAALHQVDRLTIGRGPVRAFGKASASGRELRLDLPDRRASAEHALLERVDERFRLRDTGSTNGTFLNGKRVQSAWLDDGDVVRIGHICLMFQLQRTARVWDASAPRWAFATFDATFAGDLARLERISTTPVPVLLLGETGTGKEVLARSIHQRSGRTGPCVGVNCGALPPTLVEAHLFGHRRGAFSGAVRDEPGFVLAAHQGSLLLDEVGDLPLTAQAALLRVLQEGEVTPVGSVRPTKVSVRFLAATHQPIDEMVADGRFRTDLYARLCGFVFRLPPLRERLCDLGLLVAEVLKAQAIESVRIRPEVIEAWLAYDWPLNVRELAQSLTSSAALATDGTLRLENLSQAIAAREPVSAPLSAADAKLRAELAAALDRADGNVSAVAREMGKARQQVQRWIRRFGLSARKHGS